MSDWGAALAYPDIYDVTYSYTGFQQSQGDNSFPGTQLDNDLQGLRASAESVDTFLRSALRSDGKVQNGSVGREALGPSVFLGFSPPTVWLPDTGYVQDVSTIFYNGKFYSAAVTHTSDNVFDASKWIFIANMLEAIRYTTPARSQDQTLEAAALLRIDATLERVPNDGTADASAKLREIVAWVTANQPFVGAHLDCSNGVFRIDGTVVVNGTNLVIGGRGEGERAHFLRNHDAGPQFTFSAPGTGANVLIGSGLRYCNILDQGTGANTLGQATGCIATNANSPCGVLFETCSQHVLDSVSFVNESLHTFGVNLYSPRNLKMLFNRTYDAGRTAWYTKGGELPASAIPKGANMYGDSVQIIGGLIDYATNTLHPSIDYGIRVDYFDGFYINGIYVGLTKLGNYLLNPESGKPLYNVGFSDAFTDICAGDGLIAQGSEPIIGFDFSGTASAGRFGTSSSGIKITNPMKGFSIDIKRLEGWTAAGVLLNNADMTTGEVYVRNALNVSTAVVVVNAGKNIAIHPGVFNGLDLNEAAPCATYGVFVGGGGACDNITVSGGKIINCNDGVFVVAGATNTGIDGVDLRGNTNAITDAGTATKAKGNLGVVDIPAPVKGDVGLGNVDNTSDANKPVSTAQQTALDAKVTGPASVTDDLPAVFDGTTGKLVKSKAYAAFKTLLSLVKVDVGLGNVDNTSDATKNAAVATLTNKTLVTPALGAATATSINGVTLDALAWTTYNPTVTATVGTFTSVAGAGRYKLLGKTLHISVQIVVTTVGTASGNMVIPLPGGMTSATGIQALTGSNASGGAVVLGVIFSGATSIQLGGGISAATYVVTGVIELA